MAAPRDPFEDYIDSGLSYDEWEKRRRELEQQQRDPVDAYLNDYIDSGAPLADFVAHKEAESKTGRLVTAGSQLARGASLLGEMPLKAVSMEVSHANLRHKKLFDEIDSGALTEDGFRQRIMSGPQTVGRLGLSDDVLQYFRGGQDDRAKLREKYDDTNPTDNASYQAGEAFRRTVENFTRVNPAYKDEWLASKIPHALGTTLAFGVAGVGTGGAGAIMMGSAATAVDQFEDALNHNASIEDAFKAADLGKVLGTSEGVPISMFLSRLDKFTGGGVKRWLKDVLIQGTEEAIQEFVQTVGQNFIANKLVAYDPERGTFTGSGEAAGIGFTVGGLIEFVGGLVTGRHRRGAQPPPGEQPPPAGTAAGAQPPPGPAPMTSPEAQRVRQEPYFGTAPPAPIGPQTPEVRLGVPVRAPTQEELDSSLPTGTLVNGTEALNQFDGSGRAVDPVAPPPPPPAAPVTSEGWEPLYDEEDNVIGETNAAGQMRPIQPKESPNAQQAVPTGQQEIPVVEVEAPAQGEGQQAAVPGDGGKVQGPEEPARDDDGEAQAVLAPPILRADGKPWPTEESARTAARMRKQFKDYKDTEIEVVPVEGGYGLRLKTQEPPVSVEGSQTPVAASVPGSTPTPQPAGPAPAAGETPSAPISESEGAAGLSALFGGTPVKPLTDDHTPHTDAGDGTRHAPVDIKTAADLEAIKDRVARRKSDGQKDAENYPSGHGKYKGNSLTFEEAPGTVRESKADAPTKWKTPMTAYYGRIKGTDAADSTPEKKQHLDFYMGQNPESDNVFVIDQYDLETQSFDEHKVMFGHNTQKEAEATYDRHFSDGKGKQRRVDVVPMTIEQFNTWKADKANLKRPAADTKAVSPVPPGTPPKQPPAEDVAKPPAPAAPEAGGDAASDIDDFDDIFDEAMGKKPAAPTPTPEAAPSPGQSAPPSAPAPAPEAEKPDAEVYLPPSKKPFRSRAAAIVWRDTHKEGGRLALKGQGYLAVQIKGGWGLKKRKAPPLGASAGDAVARAQNPDIADAITFLAGHGGILDNEGHDLKNTIGNVPVPGVGQLFTNDGMSLNEAEELLRDAGYFADGEYDPDAPTKGRNVIGFLEEAKRNKRYVPGSAGEKAAQPVEDQAVRAREELNQIATGYGIDPDGFTTEELQALVDDQKAKDAAADAEERAAIQAVESELEQAENTPDEEAIPFDEGTAPGPGDQGAGTPLDETGDGQEAAIGGEEGGPGDGEGVPEGPGPREPDAGEAPPQEQDGVAPPKVNVLDVGERLEGARKHAYENLDAAMQGEAADAAKALLEETSRSTLMPIGLDAEASNGTRAYLERFRGKVKTFLDTVNGMTGGRKGGRSRYRKRTSPTDALVEYLSATAWNEEAATRHRKEMIERAAKYMAFLREIENLTKHSLTLAEAEQALGRALFSNYDEAVKEYEADSKKTLRHALKRSDLGEQFSTLSTEYSIGAFFDPERGVNLRAGLKDDMPIETADKAKPLRPPKLDKIVREGLPERRPGNKNVTPEDFMTTFGFRGVQFGNYVNEAEGMRAINSAYDALLDLAETLNIDPKNISFPKEGLRDEIDPKTEKPTGRKVPIGRMGIAFGARGKGGKAAAHYEPDLHVINITKNAGDGTLAHEWMHALDFALRASKTDGARYTQIVNELKTGLQKKYDMLGAISQLDRLLTGSSFIKGNKSRGPIKTGEDYISHFWYQWAGRTGTTFAAEAKELGAYWKDPVELWARAGEAAIYDMIPGKSPYLVSDWVSDSHVTKAAGYRGTPYPTGDERAMFTAMYAGFFNALRFVNGEVTIDQEYKGPTHEARKQVQDALDEIGKDLEGRRERLLGRKGGDANVFDDPEARKKRYGTVAHYWNDDNLNRQGLGLAFAEFFAIETNKFASIRDAQKMAEELLGAAITNAVDLKALEESVELGAVLAGRSIFERMSQSGASHAAVFQTLVELYQRMPLLLTRTSTSVTNQAYSTPVPMAYLANVLAGVGPNTTLFEPTAGQGALALTATANLVFANELDPVRAKSLTLQGFQVSTEDALTKQVSGVDTVIANPPFGTLKDDKGTIRNFKTPMFETTALDHAIALKALESMKNEGRAVLIIAGQKHLGNDPDGARRQGLYNSAKNRAFFKYLFDTYNVTAHFTVDGALYKRQGAAWPIDIIVIDGRGKSALKLPGVAAPKIYESFDDLKTLLNGTPHGATERILDTEALGLGTGQPLSDAGSGVGARPSDADEGDVVTPPGTPGAGPAQPKPKGGGPNRLPRPGSGQSPGPVAGGAEELGDDPVPGGAGDSGNAGAGQGDVAGGSDGQRPRGGDLAAGDDARGLAEHHQQLDDLSDFDDIFDEAMGSTGGAANLAAPAPEQQPEQSMGPVDRLTGGWQLWDPRKTYTAAPVKPWSPRRLEEPTGPKKLKPKSAGEAAKDAAVNTAKGLDEAVTALAELFGATPRQSRITSFVGFDSKTYEAAKPHFIKALEHFRGAANDLRAMAKDLIKSLHEVYGWTSEVMDKVKPYILHFMQEVKAGRVPGFGKQRAENKEVETKLQVRYTPASRFTPVGTLIPSNMITAVREALESVVERHGDIDIYVTKKLGMTLEQGEKVLSAEQVDALALAIDNIEQRKGFIIGDQTGVGKGRFVAGMIKYALNQGLTPIFVTQGPKLYADMYRDTSALGMDDQFKPLITNKDNNGNVTLEDGSVVRSLKGAENDEAMQKVIATGALPQGYTLLMTTYNQLQTERGVKDFRHEAVDALAPNALMILDESHEAGGTEGAQRIDKNTNMPIQSRSQYIRELIAAARGTVYSSATYAKNPHTMTLYSTTDMALAVDSIKDLTETIRKGGVPLQQVVANMLVKAGQYLRRERSYDGVSFSTKKSDVDMAAYRGTAQRLRDIFDLDRQMIEVRVAYGDFLNQEGDGLASDNAVGEEGVSSATFSSMMHNVISQTLMALKADMAAQEAIDAWKADKKPIITLSNTLGTLLQEHVKEFNLKTGSKIVGYNFNQLFLRYLKRTRTVGIKDAYDKNKPPKKHYITDAEMQEIGFGHLIELYDYVQSQIEGTDLSSIPASPIDYMLEKMRAATKIDPVTGQTVHMRVAEITGRQEIIVTVNGVQKLATRDNGSGAKGKIVNDFNGGELDALIMNRSGSTGLSLHASITFKDQKTRVMILMQSEANIDIYMQMMGRIHRTGQVALPEYVILMANIPAERRPGAIVAGKMKSLNANTSANSDSAFTDNEAVDFMNQYGDEIVTQVLIADPEYQRIFNLPVKTPTSADEGSARNDGIARKATGKAAILLPEEQEEFLDIIVQAYLEHIAHLDSLGENLLTAKERDLQAATLRKLVLVPGKGEGSPFLEPAYLERIEAQRLGRPYPLSDVQKKVEEAKNKKPGTTWFNDREDQQKSMAVTIIAPLEEVKEAAYKDMREIYDAKREFAHQNGAEAANQKFGPLIVAAELKDEKATTRLKEAQTLSDTAMNYLRIYQPGAAVKITVGTGEDSQDFLGIILDHNYEAKTKNPLALSNSTITIAVADAARELKITYSQLANQRYTMVRHDPTQVRNAFNEGLSTSREQRWMITGNLLSGFNSFRKGQIIFFTDEFGKVREGIMMSPKFDPQKELEKRAVKFATAEQVVAFLRQVPNNSAIVSSTDGAVLLTRNGRGDWVLKIRPKGGRQYYTNPDLVRIVGQFYQKGGKGHYEVDTPRGERIVQALTYISDTFEVSFQTDQHKHVAKKITGQQDLQQVPNPPGSAMLALKRKVADKKAAGVTEQVTVYDANDQPVLADQFVVPGAEQSPEQKAQAERDRQKAALALMAKQSKMRSSKPQAGPQEEQGVLFGEPPPKPKQGTLFGGLRRTPGFFSRGTPVSDVAAVNDDANDILEPGEFDYEWRRTMVPLDAIDLTGSVPPPYDAERVARVERQTADGTAAPILLALQPDGRVTLLDGGHRIDAARRAGKTEIDALVGRAPRNAMFALKRARLEPSLGGMEGQATGIAEDLIARLKQMDPSGRLGLGVTEKIEEWINGQLSAADGKYLERLITIAQNAEDKGWTLDHEIVHGLRDLGVIRDAEWKALTKTVRETRMPVKDANGNEIKDERGNVVFETHLERADRIYRDVYATMFPADILDDKIMEEAVADLNADFHQGDVDLKGFARSGLQRVQDFLRALWEAISGSGFTDGFTGSTAPDAILGRVADGTMGRRGGVDGPRSIREMFAAAWHGTPHEVEGGFSTDKIGTGEGAQAYGWGLYFAGARAVADFYRKSLSAGRRDITVTGTTQPIYVKIVDAAAREAIRNDALTTEAVVDALRERAVKHREQAKNWAALIKTYPPYGGYEVNLRESILNASASADMNDRLAGEVESGKINVEFDSKANGRTYKVELAPKEDEYLMWDEGVGSMPAKVRKALEQVAFDVGMDKAKNGGLNHLRGSTVYDMIAREMGKDMMLGKPPMQYGPARIKDEKAASLKLKELGVRGIKYLDGMSRNDDVTIKEVTVDGEKMYEVDPGGLNSNRTTQFETRDEAEAYADGFRTYNYVIFDGADVKITGQFGNLRPAKSQAQRDQDLEALMGAISANFSQAETIEEDVVGVSASMEGMIKLFGERMYDSDLSSVTIKELLQNSWDAVKSGYAVGHLKPGEGKVTVTVNKTARTIKFADNGYGMTPEIVKEAFLTLAGTNKEALEEALRSGGLGLAKLAFLFGNKRLILRTVRDGVMTELDTSGPELIAGKAKRKVTRGVKDPNGTTVEITIPDTYTKNGEVQDMPFYLGTHLPDMLARPLLGDVEVVYEFAGGLTSWDKDTTTVAPIGRNLDLSKMPKVTTAHFRWGDVEIYMSEKVIGDRYPDQVALSSGMYQFSSGIPTRPDGYDKIPYKFIFNVLPSVSAHNQDYPFNNQREGWNKSVLADVGALKNYFTAWNHATNAEVTGKEFADVQIMPVVGPMTAKQAGMWPQMFKAGDLQNYMPTTRAGAAIPQDIVITNGQADIDFPEMLDFKNFSIDQDRVPVDAPLFESHLNVDLVNAAAAKHGVPEQNMRYLIARLGTLTKEFAAGLGNIPRYKGFQGERAIGISLDKTGQNAGYQGLNIKVPYKGFFLNPWGPFTINLKKPKAIAQQLVHTMMHEATHEVQGEHEEAFTTQLAFLYGLYAEHNDLPTGYYEDRIEEVINEHRAAWDALRDVFADPATKNVAGSGAGEKAAVGQGRAGGDPDFARESGGEDGTGGFEGSPGDAAQAEVGGVTEAPDLGRVRPQFSLRRAPAIGSTAFERWFKESKVVDKNGAPLVVYHGGDPNIETFRTLTFFGDRDTANSYAEERGYSYDETESYNSMVYPVYLSIQNPARDQDILDAAEAVGVVEDGVPVYEYLSPAMQTMDGAEKKVVEYLKRQGFDGAIIDNDFDIHDERKQVRSYVIFESTQAKSTSNNGNFDPSDKRIMYGGLRPVTPAPTFYSALTRAAESVTQSKAPAAHWAGIIDSLKAKGVKPAEIEWSGVKEWLAEQKGSVTKEQVLDFLRANEVQVQEVVKGEQSGQRNLTWNVREEMRAWIRDEFPVGPERRAALAAEVGVVDGNRDAFGGLEGLGAPDELLGAYRRAAQPPVDEINAEIRRLSHWPGEPQTARDPANQARLDELNRAWEVAEAPALNPPEYAKWQLPGGQSYRELVLTLPQKAMTAKELPPGYEVKKNSITGGAAWIVTGPGPLGENRYASGVNEEAALQNYWQLHGNDAAFQGGHFKGHVNTIGWVRFNERTDADGKRVLFIEEIQSDWAQKGRRQGFAAEEKAAWPTELPAGFTVEQEPEVPNSIYIPSFEVWLRDQPWYQSYADRRVEVARARELYEEWKSRETATIRRWLVKDATGDIFARDYNRESVVNQALNRIGAAERERRGKSGDPVPDGPFVTDTEQWAGLMFKRALRWASENGFQKVAWTTGEQQVARYSEALRKEVGRIEWTKTTEGIHIVGYKGGRRGKVQQMSDGSWQVIGPRGEFWGEYKDEDTANKVLNQGPGVLGEKVVDTVEKESALSDAIGKAMGDKIIADPAQSGYFEGDDITVSDTGMAGFYDKILPSYISKYVKKWGAKVGKTKIGVRAQNLAEYVTGTDGNGTYMVHKTEPFEIVSEGHTYDEAEKIALKLNDEAFSTTVHSVDITEPMRESVKQGQPMFALKWARSGAGVRRGFAESFTAEDGAQWEIRAPDRLPGRTNDPGYEVWRNGDIVDAAPTKAEAKKMAEDYAAALARGESIPGVRIAPMFALRPAGGPSIFGDQTQARAQQDEEHQQIVAPMIAALRSPGGPLEPGTVQKVVDEWRETIQDKFLPVMRVQQMIEESIERPLTDAENVYQAETVMSGRIGAQMDDLAEDHVRPLFEDMQARGVTLDEMELYLYARHAPERNARINLINPEFGEDTGSGMSNAEARDVMDAIERSGKMKAVEALAVRVDAIRDTALQQRIDAGLLSEDMAATWDANVRDRLYQAKIDAAVTPEEIAAAEAWKTERIHAYEFYVPLRGKGELDPALEADRPRVQKGISIRGPESRRAFGRQSKATDILAYSLMQAQEAILRAERNRVAQAFYELARSHPDTEFWKVNKITFKPVLNKATVLVERKAIRAITAEDADYTVSLKIDGVEHRVTMNRDNPKAVKLAEAMRNLKGQEMKAFVKWFGAVGRFFSRINTNWNYEFVISNAFRDAQTGLIHINQFERDGIVKNTAKYYLSTKSLVATTKGAFRNFEGEWGGWYKRFKDAGGVVAFNTIEDLHEQRKSIERAMADAKPGISARKAWVGLFRFVDRVNGGVENAMRLAAFRAAIESGMTDDQAGFLAKELTVNFNRHGTAGPMINSAYVFFNANIQGTTRMITANVTSSRVRKITAGIVMTGTMIAILNAMVAGDDDDGESYYDKLTEFEKSRNLILFYGPGKTDFVKIPLSYGYNVFFNIGRMPVDLYRGKKLGDVMLGQAMAMLDAFSPMGSHKLLNMILPTVFDPVADLVTNRDFMDRPILPDQHPFDDPVPDSSRYWDSVSPFAKTITDFLNSATGGTDVVPGSIDVSPETLEYAFGVVTGAAGTSLNRLAELPFKLSDKGYEFEWNDVPLARRVKGNVGTWVNRTAFYDRTSEIDDMLNNYKDYLKTGRSELAEDYYDEHGPFIDLAYGGLGTNVREQLAIMRKLDAAEKKQVEEKTLSQEEYLASRTDRRTVESEALTLFNTAYLEAKKAAE